MATAPDIFTKTCTYNGTEPCLRMQTRGQLLRLTGLPTNWKTARVAMIASLTTPAGDNSTPVAETLGATYDTHQTWLMGLSDGVGFPYDVSSGHFVGVRVNSGQNIAVVNASSAWGISQDGGSNLYWRPFWTNAHTSLQGGTDNAPSVPKMTDPTAVTAYCFGIVAEMDVSVAGTLTTAMAVTQNLGRADSVQMSAIINATLPAGASTTGTTGWWSSTVPVACQNFFIRQPVHGLD